MCNCTAINLLPYIIASFRTVRTAALATVDAAAAAAAPLVMHTLLLGSRPDLDTLTDDTAQPPALLLLVLMLSAASCVCVALALPALLRWCTIGQVSVN